MKDEEMWRMRAEKVGQNKMNKTTAKQLKKQFEEQFEGVFKEIKAKKEKKMLIERNETIYWIGISLGAGMAFLGCHNALGFELAITKTMFLCCGLASFCIGILLLISLKKEDEERAKW